MFGKSYREPKPEDNLDPTVSNPSSNNPMTDRRPNFSETTTKIQSPVSQVETEENNKLDTSEVVNNVENISRIVSPYFIVLIGLALYRENLLIGTVLIGMGILFLLKVSRNDINNFFNWIKNLLGFGENQS